jgi:hypothetical protein
MKIETLERIEMIINFTDIIALRTAIENVADAMLYNGFEESDVKEYIQVYLNDFLGE